jgi:hypothetical protein
MNGAWRGPGPTVPCQPTGSVKDQFVASYTGSLMKVGYTHLVVRALATWKHPLIY